MATGVAVASAALAALPLAGQTAAWNEARVLDLVSRARDLRQEASVDSAFHSYRAEARGYVYFFLDRPDAEERTLVKADQIAIELYWRAPDETRQRIVGLRDEKLLPTNIRYHLDHLTVVQDEFGDVIRIGDGDEVSAVIHPVAPGSEATYDFRLTDSLTISFPGAGVEPVRVYQVQVRPRDFSRPGFLGTVFLDRGTAAIVRMNFTFTPASYVDPYLDYIRISLDNALWEGKYWLPYRQEAELRRELPQLDFLGGSVIRGRFEIGGYELNEDLPPAVFRTMRVSAVPLAQRLEFPFERPLFDHLEQEGLVPPPSLEEIRRQAREMAAGKVLSGLSPLRLHLPSASHALRYNRAEGVLVGWGVVLRPAADVALRAWAGYGFSARRPSATLELASTGAGVAAGASLRVHAHELRDLGPVPGASGVLNTLSALVGDRDYLDPYFATGARATLPVWRGAAGALGRASVTGSLVLERHRSATLAVGGGEGVGEGGGEGGGEGEGRFRPVRPVEEGDLVAADLRVDAGADPSPWRVGGSARYGAFEGRAYATARLEAAGSRESVWRDLTFRVAAQGGAQTRGAPPQELFVLGGRETLLGHPYRAFVGNRYWLAEARASRTLLSPWLSGRLVAAAGWTELAGRELPAGWTGQGDAGVKASVGAGVGLAWEVIHLDLARGLGGGGWGLSLSASPRFRGWL